VFKSNKFYGYCNYCKLYHSDDILCNKILNSFQKNNDNNNGNYYHYGYELNAKKKLPDLSHNQMERILSDVYAFQKMK